MLQGLAWAVCSRPSGLLLYSARAPLLSLRWSRHRYQLVRLIHQCTHLEFGTVQSRFPGFDRYLSAGREKPGEVYVPLPLTPPPTRATLDAMVVIRPERARVPAASTLETI